jgi:hypothetical protein
MPTCITTTKDKPAPVEGHQGRSKTNRIGCQSSQLTGTKDAASNTTMRVPSASYVRSLR